MKRSFGYTFASLMLLAFASEANAVASGFYMGFATGPATNSGKTAQAQVQGSTATTPAKPKSKQWGTRVFMGNKFLPYAGWELGGTFYSSISYDTQGVQTCSGLTTSVRDIDLLLRGSFPFRSVEVFGKGGVAWVYTTTPGAFYSPSAGKSCGDSVHKTGFKPMFAIGASYDLSQNWVIDATWTRTLVGSFVNNVDLYSIGLSYHFVDRYCGQFLCDY